jgi:hypothetical protein
MLTARRKLGVIVARGSVLVSLLVIWVGSGAYLHMFAVCLLILYGTAGMIHVNRVVGVFLFFSSHFSHLSRIV